MSIHCFNGSHLHERFWMPAPCAPLQHETEDAKRWMFFFFFLQLTIRLSQLVVRAAPGYRRLRLRT